MSKLKVVAIPDTTRIIINIGVEDIEASYGHNPEPLFSIGDEIIVYEEGPKIIDPDTSEDLGSYDFVKATMEITEIHPRFSVARHIVRKEIKSITTMISPMLGGYEELSYKELEVDPSDLLKQQDYKKTIKIGDLVRFI